MSSAKLPRKNIGLLALVLGCVLASSPFVSLAQVAASTPSPEKWHVYVGTYTSGHSKGIYLFQLDAASGDLHRLGLAAEVVNPSFLAIHPNRKFIYAVGEIADFAGGKSGAVSAFAVDSNSGRLELLNQQPSGGRGPCHISMHPDGKHVLVANYSSGSAAALPIGEDGALAEPSSVVQHEGSGPDPRRQKGPHAHSINPDAAGRFAFVADLGLDGIFVYRFDAAKGLLTPNDPPVAKTPPGGGPRHFAFHPSGRFAYTNNEMGSSVTVFAYDAQHGALLDVQTVGTLPGGNSEPNTTAEIQVHPSGKFVYCSNRGHDSIAIFKVDAETGKLTPVGHESSRGNTPRNFGIDPTGTWLIAANQNSHDVAVFRIDGDTGRLQPVGEPMHVPSPVCVKFRALP